MNFQLIGLIMFLLCFGQPLKAQKSPFSYKNENLTNIIKQIETESNWVFNYNPEALGEYTFTGELKAENIQTQLNQLFYKTPYTYELSDKAVLVYLETPKVYRICGAIKDRENRATLPLANIFSDDQKHGIQTDSEGNFDFSFTAYKHQMVKISYIGYQSQSFMVQEFNQDECKDFLLIIDTNLFGEEIIIRDYLLEEITEGATYNAIDIDYQRLSNKQPIIEQDILKTVQLIPGVNSIDESATNLQIRGGTPDQNLILWEDVTLYDPGHLFGMISAINPFVIEKVQVFKGSFDPHYDNRVGGIVDLSLSDSISNNFHGGIGSTLTEAHAYFKVPIIKNKMSLLVSGRNTINSLYNSPTLSNYATKVFQESKVEEEKEAIAEGDREVSQNLDFYDLNGKFIFKPVDNFTLKASWFKSYNAFNYSSLLLEDQLASNDEVYFTSEAVSLSGAYNFSEKWSGKLAYMSSSYNNDYRLKFIEQSDNLVTYNNKVTNDILDRTLAFSTQYQRQSNLVLTAGYDYNYKVVNFNVLVEAIYEEDIEDFNFVEGHFHNAFTAFSYQQNNLQLNAGLRATYYQETKHSTISPRFNLQYALNKQLKLKLSGGIFQQYISQLNEFGENALNLNNQAWIINRAENEENVFQSAKKIATGFVFHKNGWLVDLEGYYNKTAGLSTLSPLFGTNVADDIDFSTGNSTSKGIDFLINKHWKGYHVWLNYSLSKVNFFFSEIEDQPFRATNDQRHNLSLVNSWNYKNWNFSLSYQFKTGLPFTKGLAVGNDTDEEEEVYYFIEYGDPNYQKLDNYSRLDLGVSYRPAFKNTKIKSEISFSLVNLFNKINVFSRNYYLEELDDLEEGEEAIPEIFEVSRRLLKRTPLVLVRVYW